MYSIVSKSFKQLRIRLWCNDFGYDDFKLLARFTAEGKVFDVLN